MRLLPVLVCLSVLSLACSSLTGDKKKEDPGLGQAPAMPEVTTPPASAGPVTAVELRDPNAPAVLPSTDGVADSQKAAVQSGRLLPPNVKVIAPEIPAGVTLEDFDRDVDYLAKTQTIPSCPSPAKLMEQVSGYEKWVYCGLSNGVRHGPWMAYYKGGKGDGKLKEFGPYYGGYRNGWFTHYNEQGRKDSHYEWRDGEPVSGEVFQ